MDRELTEKALIEYAGKRKVKDTKWMVSARRAMERAILIDLFTEREILKDIKVTEQEIEAVYKKHSGMLAQKGREIPLSEVKEEIRRIVESDKRRKVLGDFKETLRKKAKVRINDKILQKT